MTDSKTINGDQDKGSFIERLGDPNAFDVLMEFTCPAGKPPIKALDFLDALGGGVSLPGGFAITGVSVTHNPSGVVTASPGDVLAHLLQSGGLHGLEYIPHVSAKGMNKAALKTYLKGLMSHFSGLTPHGLRSCFVVTGDHPSDSAPVFELDSVNLLQMIRQMNAEARVKAGPTGPAAELATGAAVGLAKYEEAACLQQMIKLEKKIHAGGASFVTPNLIFDTRKVENLFKYLAERELTVPVVGYVFLLTEPAARRMRDEKLPGVYIHPDLYEAVAGESFDENISRAARQVAMWRDLGAAGIDLGNVEDLDVAVRILEEAAAVGPAWREAEEKDSFPPPLDDPYYIFTDGGERTELRDPDVPARRLFVNWIHSLFFEPGSTGYKAVKGLFERSRSMQNGAGLLYEATKLIEYVGKSTLARCHACGDCHLPENFFVCLLGECTKGLTNVPCGDSTVNGRCGVDQVRPCAGKLVYDAARHFTKGNEALHELINAPRDPDLDQTSSFRNFFLEQDHHRRAPIIQVAELLHASLPKVKEAFAIIESTSSGFETPSPGLDYLGKLIESQVYYGPDYIDANVDDAGEGRSESTAALMRSVVGLICERGGGIPPCVDSSDPAVITAGLEEYYRVNGQGAVLPLINSANDERKDFVWPLTGIGPFNIVFMLNAGALSGGGGGGAETTPEELEQKALAFFREARQHGFAPHQIFFDNTVIPLAVEFTRYGQPGFNHVNIEGIRRIMSNAEMKGVHTILGITNLIRDFPPGRKMGLLRGYLQIAMEAGLDAAIVNVARKFGIKKPADPEIVGIARAFVGQDGSPEAFDRMQEAYTRYKSYGVKKK